MTRSILVVEDNQSIRKQLSLILRNTGYAVCVASNGYEALANLEKHSFDMIITDLCIPGPDGMEVLRAAKGSHAGTVVMVITALDS